MDSTRRRGPPNSADGHGCGVGVRERPARLSAGNLQGRYLANLPHATDASEVTRLLASFVWGHAPQKEETSWT